MTADAKFSDVCGENVKISEDKTTATWIPKNCCGWACCEEKFKPGDVIQVKIEGSGRCDIGFMKGEQNQSTFKTLNEVRAHRRTCNIEMVSKENGDEIQISSKFVDKTFKKKIEKDASCWIAVYIRYGDMSVELFTKGPTQGSLKFSPTSCGKNIKLDNDNTTASSISRNPASICFLSERLQVGETLQLVCEPEKEGERPPSRYDIKLHICENDPTTLKDEFKYLFDAFEEEKSNIPLTTIESFEKEDCKGTIDITLSKDNTVMYRTARGKLNSQTLNFTADSGVWVVLNLYRVTIKSNKCGIVSEEVKEPPEPLDQLDSVPLRPRVTAVPPEGEAIQPRPTVLPSTSGTAVQRRNEISGNERDRVRFLEGRVKSLEEEVLGLRYKEQQNKTGEAQATSYPNQEMPRQISNADTNVLSEEVGDVLNVQKNFPELVQSIDTMSLCDHLYACNVLTEGQLENLHSSYRSSNSHANRELLKILKTKRIEKSLMIKILEKTQQEHLLKLFYPPP